MNKKKCQDFLIEHLKDHNEAVAYLNAALEESLKGDEESQHVFLLALRNVAEAQGGLGALAKKAHVGRESLYKTLSDTGNPKWHTLVSLCFAMGLNLRLTTTSIKQLDNFFMKYEDLPELFPEIYAGSNPKVQDHYHPNEYKTLFKSLNIINKIESSVPRSIKEPSSFQEIKEIPKVLHYIWLGSDLPDKYFEDVLFFSNQMREAGGISLLWTDQQDVSSLLKKWLEENSIFLVPVGAVFSNEKTMLNYHPFKAAVCSIPPNYGAASDLLRYEILDRFGGYYLDCDIKKNHIDFALLLRKGFNPLFGFVCGYFDGYPRNDIVGCLPNSVFSSNLKEIVLANYYQQTWKQANPIPDRPLMNYITVLTTGPNAFGTAVEVTLLQLDQKREGSQFENYCPYIEVCSNGSDESWVLYRHLYKQRQDKDQEYQIKHDFFLSLIAEPRILDLHKYSPDNNFDFTVLVQTLLTDHPLLFQEVDRIFMDDAEQYQKIQGMVELALKKKVTWDRFAELKVAALMGSEEMVKFLVSCESVNPFTKKTYVHVGYYDCQMASPLLLAIEQGHLKTVEVLLNSSKNDQEIRDCLYESIPALFYTGKPKFGRGQNCFWIPGHRIQELKEEKSQVLRRCIEIEQQIESYTCIDHLIKKYQ